MKIAKAPYYRMRTRDALDYFGEGPEATNQLAATLSVHPQTVRRWVRENWMDTGASMRMHLYAGGSIKLTTSKTEPTR